MPAIVEIVINPEDFGKRVPVDKLVIAQCGLEHARPLETQWSFLEAVTWIATRSRPMVLGVAPYWSEAVASMMRSFGVDCFDNNEMFAATAVAEAVAQGFCSCALKPASRACVEEWNALSREEQEAAEREHRQSHNFAFRRAHTYRCTCFDTAVRALFTAAATGKIVATAGAYRQEISRVEWLGADYDVMKGLRLATRQVELVCVSSAAVTLLWPDPAGQDPSPTRPGRPGCNVTDVEAAFKRRRDGGVPVERSQVAEWRLCIAEARALGATNLGQPETYRDILAPLYREYLGAEKR